MDVRAGGHGDRVLEVLLRLEPGFRARTVRRPAPVQHVDIIGLKRQAALEMLLGFVRAIVPQQGNADPDLGRRPARLSHRFAKVPGARQRHRLVESRLARRDQ